MAALAMLVPTRGRPDNLRRLWQAFTETCTTATTLIACVDFDDPVLPGYRELHETARGNRGAGTDGPEFHLLEAPRLRLAGTLNYYAPQVAARFPKIGFLGDDNVPRTVGWDQRYVEALDELGTGIVYGNDLLVGPDLPTQVAMTSDIVLATGLMVPPGIVHLWADNAWLELGQALDGITYLPDVVVEHLHPFARSAEWDDGYREANTRERYDADRAAFEQWRAEEMGRWVGQIRAYPPDDHPNPWPDRLALALGGVS
ncbi:hypothetical protein [Kitasatospora sp. GAS204B]|uniref:hypothetical protein n=1 Tax=unclassified Kitasatospora TaxID=2633591 RepID=UPI002475B4E6|nr:hypothetical protein [Kitasatospora sp. GAS204B]MDH6120646.1 hypothetical protein [Kitasatospora sp. GAS204B]